MKKIKYLTPILGLTAMMGVAAPIFTSCAKAEESNILPTNLLQINGVTLTGVVDGTDLSKYDTIVIPEGVQIVDEEAFYQDLVQEYRKVDLGNRKSPSKRRSIPSIKTLKLPASLRTIKAGGFAGLDRVTTLDLSSWTPETIHNITFYTEVEGEFYEVPAFGQYEWNEYRYCELKLPEGLSMQQESELQNKLSGVDENDVGAGIPDWWFVAPTTGHIDVKEGQSKNLDSVATNDTNGVYGITSDIALKLAQTFDDTKYRLEVFADKTSSTALTDYIETYDEEPTLVSTTECTVKVVTQDDEYKRAVHEGTYPMEFVEGNAINFNLNVVCRRIDDLSDKVVWTQRVEGFNAKNVFTHVDSIKLTDDDKAKLNEIWLDGTKDQKEQAWIKINNAQVSPSNAVNQLTTFAAMEDEWIDRKDSTDYIELQPHGFGSTSLTAVADDNGVKTIVPINVVGTTVDETSTGVSTVFDYSTAKGFSMLPGKQTVSYKLTFKGATTGYPGLYTARTGGNHAYFAPGYYDRNQKFVPFEFESTSLKVTYDGKLLHEGTEGEYALQNGVIKFRDDFTFEQDKELVFTVNLDLESEIILTGFKGTIAASW